MQRENDMRKGKTSLSQADSYQAIGEFWDTHDLSEFWDQTEPVQMKLGDLSESVYYRLDSDLSEKMRAVAARHGVSAETLLNLWVQEKLVSETANENG